MWEVLVNDNKLIRRLFMLALPMIAGSASYELNDIVDKQISTSLGEGNVSYLTYGGTVNEIVTGVIVASIAVVLLSNFASWISEGKTEKVERSLEQCLKYLTVLLIPVMVMCFCAGDQIVSLLYKRGSFVDKDVAATYSVVIGYALGFIFQAIRANVVKVFYAFQDTKTPMINGVIAVAINILMSITLSKVIGVSGIAVATSIAMMFASGLLLKDARKYLPGLSIRNCKKEIMKGVASGSIVGLLVCLIRKSIVVNTYMGLVIEGIVCVVMYYVLMVLLKSDSAKVMNEFIFKMITKKDN